MQQQQITWLDADLEAELELEFEDLEEDQEFLEQFFGMSMLLDVLTQAEDESRTSYAS